MKAHPTTTYNRVGPHVWMRVREAYLSGLSAPTVAARFGVSVPALRRRAAREGWTKSAAALAASHPFAEGGRAPPGGSRPGDPTPVTSPPPVSVLLDRLYPPSPGPIGLIHQALDQARGAVRDGDGLRAQRLARAADAIRRLEDWYERRLDRTPFDEASVMEAEVAETRRTETMKTWIADMALHLARDLAAGRPLPPDYQALVDRYGTPD